MNKMNTQSTQFEVRSIIFESNDNEVLLKGTQIQGLLSYDVDMIISQSQLNLILGQLQDNNELDDIMGLFETNRLYDNVDLYTANFDSLFKSKVEIDPVLSVNNIRKIRA